MKVTVVGAGNVGATCADVIAHKDFVHEVVLLDIKEGIAEGKSLDMWQTSPINLYDTRIIGSTNDYSKTAGSDVVVITSGLPRKPGMSRDDLIATNAGIVKSVTENIVKYSPNTIIIVVSNPLDVMTYCAFLNAKFDSKRVFGMAGILDTARYRAFLAEALNTSPKDIQAVLMGVGVATALGGVASLLTPVPKMGGSEDDPRKSYSFSGIQNTSRQGVPCPIVFGECLVGSVVVSAGIDVVQVTA